MFLAGDVGGTKVNLALCEVELTKGSKEQPAIKVTAHSLRRYASSQFGSLSEVLVRYFNEVGSGSKKVRGTCFGVPGPVMNGQCQTVNLPWVLNAAEIEQETSKIFPIGPVQLINDLEATAYGLRALSYEHGLSVLRSGKVIEGVGRNQALIAPGTGLGEALIFWDGQKYVISPSEGGHTDFGPQSEEQIELLKWLWPRHKHVSWEHVASGPAVYRMYRFLKETGREKEPAELAEALHQPDIDPSPLIASLAMKGEHQICVRAFDLWLYCLGAEAGNLALKMLSFGGIYIGGGIIPNILELFKRPAFFEGLDSKGRMSALIKDMPIYGVVDPLAGLYGAAIAAAERS